MEPPVSTLDQCEANEVFCRGHGGVSLPIVDTLTVDQRNRVLAGIVRKITITTKPFCAHQLLFYENQYGFRKCHSTELAALELVDRLFKHLGDGKIPVLVFLDFSKAFDTLNHAILMDKLKYYGLYETSLNWFRSYLHDRYQYTEYNGTCSDVINLTTGVPQGSILGPLLFIIYMNDIHVATSNFTATLYADDTNLLSPMCSFSSSNSLNPTNLTEVTNSINDELSHVHELLLINKLSVNVCKIKFMIFHHQQRRIDTLISDVKLDSQSIEHVSEFNFLGLTLDEHLSWKPHVQKVANKTSQTIGILRRLKNIIPISVLRTLYNTLSLPHFHYCILSWGSEWADLNFCRNELYVSCPEVVIMHIQTHCLKNVTL